MLTSNGVSSLLRLSTPTALCKDFTTNTMSLSKTYIPFVINDKVETEENAERYVEQLVHLIAHISDNYPVYHRVRPSFEKIKDFDSGKEDYFVRARFTVGFDDTGVLPGNYSLENSHYALHI